MTIVDVSKDDVLKVLKEGICVTAIYTTGESTLGKCKFTPNGTNMYFLKNLMGRNDVRFFKIVFKE